MRRNDVTRKIIQLVGMGWDSRDGWWWPMKEVVGRECCIINPRALWLMRVDT